MAYASPTAAPVDRNVQSGTAAVESGRDELPGIRTRRGFRFRQGQASFLHKYAAALRDGDYYHLGVFVPGYGKTITALSSFVVANALGIAKKLIVFVPRGNLRDQYADPRELAQLFHNIGAPKFSFCVADSQRVFLKNRTTQIIITTYQYASGATGNRALKEVCEQTDCMFVFDEVHHLSDDGTWAESIQRLPFRTSVALSGTPMRSDNKTLFGVPFEQGLDGQAYYKALHEVNMRDAHTEGKILKRVKAHVVDYHIVLTNSLTFQRVEMPLSKLMEIAKNKNELDTFLARRQLRFHDVYLETLLSPAFEQFEQKRQHLNNFLEQRGKSGRNCQMLIIAMSNKHAAAIHEFVQKRFPAYSSTRIGQDVAERERLRRLEEYRAGQVDVMVQVDMIGEGTDIKTISLIVKADLVRAYSKTMQQIFRGMRWYKDFDARSNVCDIYASNDAELVKILEWITNEEKIGIKTQEAREGLDELPNESKGPAQPQWELTGVAHHNTESHNLELFPGFGFDDDARPLKRLKQSAQADEEEEFMADMVLDVAARENELRQECSGLAARLAFTMQNDGKKTDVRNVHSAAMRRFGKAQEQMSLDELRKKYHWLQSCVAARRIL